MLLLLTWCCLFFIYYLCLWSDLCFVYVYLLVSWPYSKMFHSYECDQHYRRDNRAEPAGISKYVYENTECIKMKTRDLNLRVTCTLNRYKWTRTFFCFMLNKLYACVPGEPSLRCDSVLIASHARPPKDKQYMNFCAIHLNYEIISGADICLYSAFLYFSYIQRRSVL